MTKKEPDVGAKVLVIVDFIVGAADEAMVGKPVAAIIGAVEVGDIDGRTLGEADGALVGFTVGASDGAMVRKTVGAKVGAVEVGDIDGRTQGKVDHHHLTRLQTHAGNYKNIN